MSAELAGGAKKNTAKKNTIRISARDRVYYAIINVILGVFFAAVLAPLINTVCRKLGWVKDGDLAL